MDALELLKTRRTVRRYKQEPISEDVLHKIVDLARYAPSGGNAQSWEMIAVDDPALAEQVYNTLAWLPALGEPPENQKPVAYLVIISDEEAGVADCASLATYSLLAAHSQGVGGCWFGSIRRTELADDLDIPDNYSIEFVISLGYPAEDAEAYDSDATTQVNVEDGTVRVPKLTVDSILHHNKYGR